MGSPAGVGTGTAAVSLVYKRFSKIIKSVFFAHNLC
jgi:hypothetical protein